MRKSTAWMLAIALAVSVGYNVYQKVSFNRLYWFWGTTLTDRLINSRIRIDQVAAETNPDKRSGGVYGVQEAPKEILDLGSNLDLMLSRVWPYPDSYLQSIGHELNMFTVGVWNRSNTSVAQPCVRSNPAPPPDELSRLSRVYRIYAGQFTNDVVLSQNSSRHRNALQAAHDQVQREGLDELLPEIVRREIMKPLN